MNLVIVESPTKARTISKFLSKKYKILASQGHLIDLPRSKLGVDIDADFEPQYITIRGKGKILKELKEAGKKADKIFLAADPDREGEAICWHIGRALKLNLEQPCRVEFNEITKEAVKEAFKTPRVIDSNRVDAQQARRVLDRLVGYKISPLLWRKIRSGLSAGRVQSVAVRLICEREEEINNFKSEEYWTLDVLLEDENSKTKFKAALDRYKKKKIELETEAETKAVVSAVRDEKFIVEKITRLQRKRKPWAPFTTSSLQQEASSKLGFTSRKTMSLAQQLYEGINVGGGETVGLITYIRTDSTKISNQAREEAKTLINEKFGADYLPVKPPVYKSRKGAQEAHEAIRPTSVSREPSLVKQFLSRDQNRLYKLIWDRFVASQMAPALYDQVRVNITAGEYSFKSTGSTLLFPGFLVLYQADETEKDTVLPRLEENQQLALMELLPEQHFTQPPPRFNEASLIKTLEEKGIGRPSTYSPIIETIQGRGYVIKEKKAFVPTELGFIVVDMMKNYFPEVINIDFTAGLEQQLDEIEEGKLEWLKVINDFYYGYFKERLEVADVKIEKVEMEPEISEESCPNCGKQLVYKHGRFGRFLACPSYPECKFTRKVVKDTGVKCPVEGCDGKIIERRSKKGRVFYGCSNYPECTFSMWNKPLPEPCPKCGLMMAEKWKAGSKSGLCTNKDCGYEKKYTGEKVAAKN
ncbi:MAG: type I DNA topoisomerase [Bacillota bacterium]|nr:type I DNA topoisomerase [Bacillota bacterium]MDW7728666.1 type I DNA topoisomerase [Bacillota bacterium]